MRRPPRAPSLDECDIENMPARPAAQSKKLLSNFIAATLAFSILPVAAQDDRGLDQQLRACRAIDDDVLRLVCYDMLGKVQSQVPASVDTMDPPPTPATPKPVEAPPVAEPVADQVPTQEPEYAPLTGDVGAWSVRNANEGKRPIRAAVTRCSQNARGAYYFHFENDQIWKYKGSRRLRYKECSFDVTITRDAFGYKMQVDGEERRLRISRIN